MPRNHSISGASKVDISRISYERKEPCSSSILARRFLSGFQESSFVREKSSKSHWICFAVGLEELERSVPSVSKIDASKYNQIDASCRWTLYFQCVSISFSLLITAGKKGGILRPQR